MQNFKNLVDLKKCTEFYFHKNRRENVPNIFICEIFFSKKNKFFHLQKKN